MEMLAIFSAIIAIILGGLNFTDKMTVFESLLVVTSLSAVCSFFISILSIILFEEKKRKISITLAVLSFAIIFVMLICACYNK